ncbi:MAG: hypothetical protein BWY39_00016 [Spirochaetes bacterium ADurb.Bin269]|nr:MAG: hypothetical protein BWY39_00016 [Spirochaetes bacterium ADurb.Bin269]
MAYGPSIFVPGTMYRKPDWVKSARDCSAVGAPISIVSVVPFFHAGSRSIEQDRTKKDKELARRSKNALNNDLFAIVYLFLV